MKKLFAVGAMPTLSALCGGISQAQTTERTRTIVVPFGAGGSTDVTACIVGEKMAVTGGR